MKKTLIFVSLLLAATAAQASTCETRVDSHQKATTRERVDYCLTPDKVAPQDPGPTLIYENVIANVPEKQTAQKNAPLKQTYYPQDEVQVARGFVGTDRFPQLKNDIPSQRELQEAQQAKIAETKKETSQQKPARTMTSQPTAVQQTTQTAQTAVSEPEDKRPVKDAQKPARTMSPSPATMMQQIESEIIAPSAGAEEGDLSARQEPASVAVADEVTREANDTFYGAQN